MNKWRLLYWERIRAKSYYNNLWTPDHTNGTEPRIEGVDLDDPQQYSSRHLFNASYLRLKNLSLAYTLPIITVVGHIHVGSIVQVSSYLIGKAQRKGYAFVGDRGIDAPIHFGNGIADDGGVEW